MKAGKFWLENTFFALLSCGIFFCWTWIDVSPFPIFLLLILTFCKCLFFILFALERVKIFASDNKKFSFFLIQFSAIVTLVIISFTTDNMIIYFNDKTSFSKVPPTNEVFEFFYFTFMNVTSAGLTEIKAESWLAKLYSMLEVFTGFVFAAYILSGIVNFKEEMIFLDKKR